MVVIINYYTPGNSSSFDVVATILYYPIFDLHCIYLLLHQKIALLFGLIIKCQQEVL